MVKPFIFLSLLAVYSNVEAACDLALIKGISNGQSYNYSPDVFDAFEAKGYRTYEVNDAFDAGRMNSNFIAYFEASCQASPFNPLMTSTVTTLTFAKEDGVTYKRAAKLSSAPQAAFGSCKIELLSLIAKLPHCK